MLTTSHPARQDGAMSTLGQRWQCSEERMAVESVLPSQPHQQPWKPHRKWGEKSQAPSYHSSVAPVWPSSGAEPGKALSKKTQKTPSHRKNPGCSWGENGGPERQGVEMCSCRGPKISTNAASKCSQWEQMVGSQELPTICSYSCHPPAAELMFPTPELLPGQ